MSLFFSQLSQFFGDLLLFCLSDLFCARRSVQHSVSLTGSPSFLKFSIVNSHQPEITKRSPLELKSYVLCYLTDQGVNSIKLK